MKITNNKTALNLTAGIITLLVQMGISFFLSPYIVKTLGEEANGLTQLANNFVTYATIITLSFNSMSSRFISVRYHQGKLDDAKLYYSSSIIANTIVGSLLFVSSIIIVIKLDSFINIDNVEVNDARILFSFVFLSFFVNLAISVISCAYFVTNRIYITNSLNLIRNVLNAALLFSVFKILPTKMYYVSGVALFLAICLLPVNIYFQKKLLPELNFSVKLFKFRAVLDMVKSGIWNTVNQCGNMLMTGLDLIICNLFISPVAMGILSVAKIVPNAIVSLATTINNSFAPSLVIDWAKGDKDETLKSLRTSMNISSIIVSIPIITFCSYSVHFYELWMPSLNAKQLSVLSFLSCMAFIPLAGPQTLYNVFTATNKLKVNSISFLISGFLNLGVVFLLLKYTNLGVYAVAGVSSSLSIIRNLVVTAPYTAKLLNLKWYSFYKDVFISILCCFVNFIVATGVEMLPFTHGWLGLVFKSIVAAFITLIIDLAIVLNKTERKMLKNKLYLKR